MCLTRSICIADSVRVSRHRPPFLALFVLCGALFLPASGEAHKTGTLTGLITDPSGAVYEHVTIRVQHWQFDEKHHAKAECDAVLYSDQGGRFKINLASGTYDLFVTAVGMSPVAKEIAIKNGRVTTLNLKLAISPLTKFVY